MNSPEPAPSRRFVVAMSGGVDSSVAALLLAREGFDVIGLFMRNGVQVSEEESRHKSCCSAGDARDARMVAAHLGFPFQAVDLSREFEHIVRAFVDEYSAGRTPNPCAICNRDLKFDRLLSFAEELGAEGVATGHYARLDIEDGRVVVRRGVDYTKDQSYQLFCVAEEHLARTRLPLGALEKSAVRELAREAGLRTAAKADSQEICFVPGSDHAAFIEDRVAPERLRPGLFKGPAGEVLGAHDGLHKFTVGQRRGLGVATGERAYVTGIDPASGDVRVGPRSALDSTGLWAASVSWAGTPPGEEGAAVTVRIRHRHRGAPGVVKPDGRGGATVEFDEAVAAVAPGQAAVFYDGDTVMGGGAITEARSA